MVSETRQALRDGLFGGLRKGWGGFVWMAKILLPISLLTSLLLWSGWLKALDFLFQPAMGWLGLPPEAAWPLLSALLVGIYAGVAAMAALPFSVDQMTLMAVFMLIAHNLIQEGVIQDRSGLSALKATLFRLGSAVVMVWLMGLALKPEPTLPLAQAAGAGGTGEPFLEMAGAWLWSTAGLMAKIFVIIMLVLVALELLKSLGAIERLVKWLAPLLRLIGLDPRVGVMWLAGAIFGLAYAAALLVEESRKGQMPPDELVRLHLSIGLNHSVVEDAAIFAALGVPVLWVVAPRLAAAVVAVHLFNGLRRLKRVNQAV